MSEQYAALRGNVGLLGQLLGQTIKDAQGQAILDKVEEIRALSKSSRSGNEDDRKALIEVLHALSDEELLPVARSFNHFLNLANVAEQFHTVSRFNDAGLGQQNPLTQTLKTLAAKAQEGQLDSNHLADALSKLHINLVLTAHPTEVTRRTIINKHVELSDCLASLERKDNLEHEREAILNRIAQLISQALTTAQLNSLLGWVETETVTHLLLHRLLRKFLTMVAGWRLIYIAEILIRYALSYLCLTLATNSLSWQAKTLNPIELCLKSLKAKCLKQWHI